MSAHADALHALRDGPPARWWHPGVVDTPNEAEIREQTTQRLEKAMGTFGTAALASMEENLPWFRRMPPDQRSWIGLVAQAGIAAFVEWFKNNEETRPAIAGEVFGTAPRELLRAVKLHHTIDMIRVIIDVVETRLGELAAPGGEAQLREAILRYTRDVAFGAAQVYARAAETRAAWDARLEALVVNAVLRGEVDDGMHSWAAALGWTSKPVTVIAGFTPEDEEPEVTIDQMQIAARRARADVLAGVQGRRVIVIVGGDTDPMEAARPIAAKCGPAPSSSGRRSPTCTTPPARRTPPSPGSAPQPAGRTRRAPSRRPSCCPNAPWTATRRPAGTWWSRSTTRCSPRAPRSSTRSPPTSSRGRRWRRPRGCCSSTPTRSATACAA